METPELSTTLAKNFADLSEWVKVAADNTGAFISREAPLFVQEYVRWVIVKGVASSLLWLIVAAILSYTAHRLWAANMKANTAAKQNGSYSSDPFFGAALAVSMIGGFGLLVTFGFVMPAASDALKAYVAPRVLLVEKAAELSGIRK